jgi:rhodanese-related sulfurtransferase
MSPAVLTVLLIAVIGGLFVVFGMRPDIKGGDARRLVAGGAKLLDVRSPGEFAAGHLPGAVNIPVDALERRLAELGPKDGTIVLYCASGARSAQAKRALVAKGFVSVHNLGPMSAW